MQQDSQQAGPHPTGLVRTGTLGRHHTVCRGIGVRIHIITQEYIGTTGTGETRGTGIPGIGGIRGIGAQATDGPGITIRGITTRGTAIRDTITTGLAMLQAIGTMASIGAAAPRRPGSEGLTASAPRPQA